jgi:uncharacterized protein with LGFP repeats
MRARVMQAALALATAFVLTTTLASAAQADSVISEASTAARVVPAAVAGFNPGNIMSDEVFFAKDTMDVAGIQAFLNGKVSNCQAGYTCLKDYAQETQTRSADLMCRSTYQGSARQTAAEIIYYVAQACGINPQVLLTTLQKEQSLITHTSPSELRFRIAMGQGCPDTAACDTRYYGFFNQVYGAAWQFKRYANPPGTNQTFTWYAPGRTWNLRYHPSLACGSSPVYVANQATANLYYYTPYQPNPAALAAGYGTGDGCSSYGNRNFYSYFTDWFGSTQTTLGREVTLAYASLGGAVGFLGEPLKPIVCGLGGGGCFQDYQGGVIYWSPGTGGWALSGDVRAVWNALDYERGFGYPVAAQVCGLPQWGCFQDFERGVIYTSVHGSFGLSGAVRTMWASLDYERGLGYPIGPQRCLAGGACYQDFEKAVVYTSALGTYVIQGDIRDAWSELDYERGLGLPAGGERPLAAGASYQDFERGVVYSSSSGAFALTGAIRAKWSALDYERGLGYPIGAMRCLSGGACFQDFERGVVYTSSLGTFVLDGEIRSTWSALDYERGLGLPAGNKKPLPNGAAFQDFERGVIYASASGVFGLAGPIRDEWVKRDYERGLGYPTGPQVCEAAGDRCTQSFERGIITWSAQTGVAVEQ